MHPAPAPPTGLRDAPPGPHGRAVARILATIVLMLPVPLALAQDAGLAYPELLALAEDAPTVRLARQALERAEKQASATAVPFELTLSGGYARRGGTLDPGDGLPSEDLGEGDVDPIAVAARIDPAIFGPGADELARARAAVDAARDDLDAARRSARIDAVQAFQDALRAAAEAALTEAEVELARRQAQDVADRREVGAASDLDVAEARLAVARAEQAQAAAARERELALRALRTSLGRDVPPPEGPLPDPPPLPDAFAADAGARPELRAAARAVAEADRSAAAQIRSVLPVVTLEAGYRAGDDGSSFDLAASIDSAAFAPTFRASFDPDDGVQGVAAGGSSRAFEIGVRLEVPLSLAVPDALAAVRLGQDQARGRLETTRAQASLAVDRAHAAARDAAELAGLAERAAELAAEDLRIARLRAAAGSASGAAARRAELDARRAELDAARARDRARLAVFRLYDALALAPETLE